MKKNEQLFRAIGKISPTYIEMAADGKVPGKKTRASAPWGRFRALGVIAAMITLAVMMFALGLSVSAAEPNPQNEEYNVGSMLMDIPEVLTQNDYQAMFAKIQDGIEADATLPQEARRHFAERFDVFWTLHDPELAKNNKQREGMQIAYPMVEITPIYAVDMHLTEDERDYLYHMMVTYGGMTQLDLIAMYQNMYDLVEGSDLPQERKQEIRASLPALPEHSPSAPPANYLTAEAEAAGKRQMTPSTLPFVLLPEDYASICNAVLTKYGAESVEALPMRLQKMLANYTKYPLELSNPETYHLMTEQHFARLTENEELYIIDPTLTIEERITLCYELAMEADVWGEDGARMAKNLYDTMEERYPGELDPTWGWVRDIIMTYWRNWIWVQDYAYVK